MYVCMHEWMPMSVRVCHTLVLRVFHSSPLSHFPRKQGGKASSDEPCPTKLSRWRGSTERRLGVYLLSCPQAVTLLFHGLIHGSFMIPSPKTGFPPQTCSRLATTLTVRVQTLFNHTVSADFSTLRFFAFLPIGKLSVTENQCQSVSRSVFPLGYWV